MTIVRMTSRTNSVEQYYDNRFKNQEIKNSIKIISAEKAARIARHIQRIEEFSQTKKILAEGVEGKRKRDKLRKEQANSEQEGMATIQYERMLTPKYLENVSPSLCSSKWTYDCWISEQRKEIELPLFVIC